MSIDSNLYDIALILPVYNEESFLSATLDSLAVQELGPYKAEILVVDGRSQDNSRKIAESYKRAGALAIRVLDNEKKLAASALNLGVRETKARIIGFGGSHALYPPGYLRLAIELIKEQHEDAVGGWCSFHSLGTGYLDEAMTLLYVSPLGAGARREYRKTEPGYVNTVYGGLFRRDVFSRCGGYDEGLRRGQDIDFNTRVREAGFKILFHPALEVRYLVKTEPRAFFRRAFLTSSAIADIFSRQKKSPGLHYFAPFALIVYLVAVLPQSLRGGPWLAAGLPLLLYFALLGLGAIKLSRKSSPRASLLTIPVFFAYHLLYGLGLPWGYLVLAGKSLRGLGKAIRRKGPPDSEKDPPYLGKDR